MMQIHCDFCPATANEPAPFSWGTVTLEGFPANPKVVYHQCPDCRTKFIEDMHKMGVNLRADKQPAPLFNVTVDTANWVCECGEKADGGSAKWRWNGTVWEHHHGYPIGHVTANYLPDLSASEQRDATSPICHQCGVRLPRGLTMNTCSTCSNAHDPEA